MSDTIEITNPAKELARIAEEFAHIPGKGQPTASIFSRAVGVGIDSAEFHDVLAALHRRITGLEALVAEVDEDALDGEERNLISVAARQLREFLHPKRAHMAWDQNVKDFLPAQSFTTLRMFSTIARRLRPLRVISEEDRNAAIERLQEAIAAVEGDTNLEQWAKISAIGGLRQIEIVLRYLKFFGHEAAIEALFTGHQKIVVVSASVPETARTSLWTALQRVAMIGALFVLPHQALNAVEQRYQHWPNNLLTYIVEQSPSEQLLLPAPDPTALRPTKPEESATAK